MAGYDLQHIYIFHIRLNIDKYISILIAYPAYNFLTCMREIM